MSKCQLFINYELSSDNAFKWLTASLFAGLSGSVLGDKLRPSLVHQQVLDLAHFSLTLSLA